MAAVAVFEVLGCFEMARTDWPLFATILRSRYNGQDVEKRVYHLPRSESDLWYE